MLVTIKHVIGGEAVVANQCDGSGFTKCIKQFTWSIQSSKSSSGSSSSPGCGRHRDRPSGPWCEPGTWTKVKWNIRIKRIHLLILAEGDMSGFASIPLIYFVSTSTTIFRTPMRYSFHNRSALYRPYNSNFGCENRASCSFNVMEPNFTTYLSLGFPRSH